MRFAERFGLTQEPADSIRDQLLHCAASAVITGEQFRAVAALVLVHSFGEQRMGRSDYQSFAALFDVDAKEGTQDTAPHEYLRFLTPLLFTI